jgi:hypothetical protein
LRGRAAEAEQADTCPNGDGFAERNGLRHSVVQRTRFKTKSGSP